MDRNVAYFDSKYCNCDPFQFDRYPIFSQKVVPYLSLELVGSQLKRKILFISYCDDRDTFCAYRLQVMSVGYPIRYKPLETNLGFGTVRYRSWWLHAIWLYVYPYRPSSFSSALDASSKFRSTAHIIGTVPWAWSRPCVTYMKILGLEKGTAGFLNF